MYCLCVNVYCHRVTTQLQLICISYRIILIKNWTYSTGLEKFSNTKFHENPPIGSQLVSCARADRQKDRRDETVSSFPPFCERALQTQNVQRTYNLTLRRVRMTIVVETQQCILCMLWLSYVSLSTIWKYWALHDNAFMVNHVAGNNALYTYQFLTGIIFQLFCTLAIRHI